MSNQNRKERGKMKMRGDGEEETNSLLNYLGDSLSEEENYNIVEKKQRQGFLKERKVI